MLRDTELLRRRALGAGARTGAALRNELEGVVLCEEREEAEPLRRREGSRAVHAEGEVACGGVDCENALGGAGWEELWKKADTEEDAEDFQTDWSC